MGHYSSTVSVSSIMCLYICLPVFIDYLHGRQWASSTRSGYSTRTAIPVAVQGIDNHTCEP